MTLLCFICGGPWPCKHQGEVLANWSGDTVELMDLVGLGAEAAEQAAQAIRKLQESLDGGWRHPG